MNSSKPLKALSFACAVFFVCAQSHAETLKDIYQQALQNDHEFRAAAAIHSANQETVNIGRSGLLPQVAFDATMGDKTTDNRLTGLEVDTASASHRLSLRQAVVDLSVWQGYKQGKAISISSNHQFARAEQALVVRAARAYFDALEAIDALNTAKAEEEALSHQLEQTKQRFEVGLTAITEVHEAQAAYDSAMANRLVADGQLGISFEALEVLTGQPYTSLAPIKDDFPVAPPEPFAREEWEELAMTNSATLKQVKAQAEAAKAGYKSKKYEHLPKVYGSAEYLRADEDNTNSTADVSGRDSDIEHTRWELTLSVPLYSGGGVSAARRQAYGEYIAANETYLKTKRDTLQAVRSNYLAVLTSAATVKARKQAITSNNSALEATRAGYDVGTRDLVDVLNAQRNLYTAQRDYYAALYTYVVSTLELREAAGILSGTQISELDQWLDGANPVKYQR